MNGRPMAVKTAEGQDLLLAMFTYDMENITNFIHGSVFFIVNKNVDYMIEIPFCMI